MAKRRRLKIISLDIDQLGFEDCLHRIVELGQQRRSSYVCFANSHMIVEANRDAAFRSQVIAADLVVADGKPLAAACRWLYGIKQERIAGMDMFPALLRETAPSGGRFFLYGSTVPVLERLKAAIRSQYPGADVVGVFSPPFGPMTTGEQQAAIEMINGSGAQYVMVSLGCPKQEKWMAENHSTIQAVLLGVGGAFAVMAGLQKRAPAWMQRAGLEWLHRLWQEPSRLFKRYFITNLGFLFLLSREKLKKIF